MRLHVHVLMSTHTGERDAIGEF